MFATFDLLSFHLPVTAALAIVALLGYCVGLRRGVKLVDMTARNRAELRRALAVAHELEEVERKLRGELAKHRSRLMKFQRQVGQLNDQHERQVWKDFCRETAEILTPTLELATQLTAAYDGIRHQTNSLMSFSEVRSDPLTGIRNRRGLDEAIDWQLTLADRYHLGFSLVIFDIDHFKHVNDRDGHLQGDRILQRLASLLADNARGTDLVSRYGGEEFLLTMPHTDLEGAGALAERIRLKVADELPITVSGGVTSVLEGDTRELIVSRADVALRQAKAAGRNCVFLHTGNEIEPICDHSGKVCNAEPQAAPALQHGSLHLVSSAISEAGGVA